MNCRFVFSVARIYLSGVLVFGMNGSLFDTDLYSCPSVCVYLYIHLHSYRRFCVRRPENRLWLRFRMTPLCYAFVKHQDPDICTQLATTTLGNVSFAVKHRKLWGCRQTICNVYDSLCYVKGQGCIRFFLDQYDTHRYVTKRIKTKRF